MVKGLSRSLLALELGQVKSFWERGVGVIIGNNTREHAT